MIKKAKEWIKHNRRIISIADIAMLVFLMFLALVVPKPANAEGLQITNSTYSTAELTWEKAEDASAYKIYRSVNNGNYEYLCTTVENSYTDRGLRTGTKYSYAISSKNGLKDSGINVKSAQEVTPSLEEPTLEIDTQKGKMQLNISDVDGAIGYEIIRNGESIGTTEANNYVDESAQGNTKYKYRVKAIRYKKQPVYSEASNSVEAELYAIPELIMEMSGEELVLEWTKDEHYSKYKIFNGDEVVGETDDSLFRMSNYELDKAYDLKLVGFSEDEKSQSPEVERRLKIVELPMDNETARNAACEWGVGIADDNSFSYGTGKRAHRYGCYFCGTNVGPNKNLKGSSKVNGHSYAKTYCCNPFVHACYSHGAGDQNMLKACQAGKGVGHSEGSFTRYGNWKKVKKPSISQLQKGDALVGSKHVMLYIGDGLIVHAKTEGWGAGSITVDKCSSYYKLCNFVMRYTGTGSGTMRVIQFIDENGNVIDNNTESQET